MLLVRPSRKRRPRRPQLSRPKSAFAAQISDCDPKIQERSPQRPMKKHPSYFFPFPIFHILPILLLTPFLLLASARTISQETMAARIAPDILRFHVLAESNSPKDQSLKLGVRDILLSHIQTHAPKNATKPQLAHWILQQKNTLTQTAESWLTSQGSPAPVSLTLTKDYFPTKSYGEASFPCGVYDAVRITIGNGKGRNWWCVLYPSLCLTDSSAKTVPESSKKELAEHMAPDDYETIFNEPPKVEIRFRLLELLTPKKD